MRERIGRIAGRLSDGQTVVEPAYIELDTKWPDDGKWGSRFILSIRNQKLVRTRLLLRGFGLSRRRPGMVAM